MKTCIDCNKELPFSAFVSKKTCIDGYEPRCRKCRVIKYAKGTPEMVCKRLYNSQVFNSKKRNHPAPEYTLIGFTDWVINNTQFMDLFTSWQASNYDRNLSPSIDRIDDTLPYTFSNIQLLTWKENKLKGAKSKKDNLLLVNHRKVAAYNKDGSLYKEYSSMAEAMREFGGKACQSWGISSVCNGIPVKDGNGHLYTPRTYKGFIWGWVN
jgi:hypothetical protein